MVPKQVYSDYSNHEAVSLETSSIFNQIILALTMSNLHIASNLVLYPPTLSLHKTDEHILAETLKKRSRSCKAHQLFLLPNVISMQI